MLRGFCIRDICLSVDAMDWDEVGTVNSGTEAVEHGAMDAKAITYANHSYSELNVVHAAVYCTVYGVLRAWYVLGTLRFVIGFGANIYCYVLEWYF